MKSFLADVSSIKPSSERNIRLAYARNDSLETLNDAEFTLSSQLMKANYFIRTVTQKGFIHKRKY